MGVRALAAVTVAVLVVSVLSAGDAAAHQGAWIDSAYTAAPPTIDGTMAAGEWADAAAVDLGAIPGNMLPAWLLVKNDGTYLYIAYDAVGDATADSGDSASVSFDTDHDAASSFGAEDQFFWGGMASNGEEHLVSDGSMWYLEDSPFDEGLPDHAGLESGWGFGPSDRSGSDHRIYELRIPLVLLGVAPGGVVGFLGASGPSPGVVDFALFTYSTWPMFLFGPPPLGQYGDLRLGQPPQANDLDLNPPSQTRSGLSGSLDSTITVVNRGTAADVFDLELFSPLPATLWDATGTNPLVDSDGDTIPDSGTLPAGGSVDIVARTDVPAGGCSDAVVRGTSSNDVLVSDSALVRTCGLAATLDPPHADLGVDTDLPPNGLYDVLEVDVSVLVNTPGFFELDLILWDATQSSTITFGYFYGPLDPGSTSVPVGLSGIDIYQSGINGPYLAEIFLYDDAFALLDSGTHSTAAYGFMEFDGPGAILNPPHADAGEDTDAPPNGLYDALRIDVSVLVGEPGMYFIDLVLLDQTGMTTITWGFQGGFLDPGPNTMPVYLSGTDIYGSGIDGPYLAAMNLYDAGFNLLDSGTHLTGPYLSTDFDPPAAAFNPPHADRGEDRDVPPNGLYDVLVLDVGVRVVEAGTFQLEGVLFDPMFGPIAYASGDYTLGVGDHVVPLEFLGRDIFVSGIDGPYTADLRLYRDFAFLDQDYYTTAFYAYSDFDPPPAWFNPPHADQGVDLSVPPDGLYEFLEVDASLDVTEAGSYAVFAVLYDPMTWTMISTAETILDLGVGAQQVPVRFNGIDIWTPLFNGPYGVDLYLLDDLGILDYDFHMTAAYGASEFSPPGAFFSPPHADRLLDADVPADGLADFLAVDVSLDVFVPGAYEVRGALSTFSDMNTIDFAVSNCGGPVPAGPAVCTLRFDGHRLADLGAEGIFTVGLTLYDSYGRRLGTDAHSTWIYRAGDFEPSDTVAPSSAAGSVPYWNNRQPLDVPYSAVDPSPTDGLASATLYYRFSANNATWSAWTAGPTVSASGASASGSIPFSFPRGPGYYEFQVVAADLAGNAEPVIAGGAGVEALAAFRPLANLVLTPPNPAVTAGQQVTLTITVRDPTGAPAPVAAPLTLYLAAQSPTGEFRATGTPNPVTDVTIPAGASSATVDYYDTTAGTWTVYAASSETAPASVPVAVSPAAPATVAVSPSSTLVPVGTTQAFAAVAFDAFGNDVGASFTWSADAALGAISGAGVLTAAQRPASGVVRATVVGAPSVEGTAAVTLVAGPPALVTISPSSGAGVNVVVGRTQQFLAFAWDAYGNQVLPSFTWSADPAIGTISSTGFFTAATTVAIGDVQVSVVGFPTVQASTPVQLIPDGPATVTLDPPTATVAVGGTVTFAVAVEDQYGNGVAPAVTWSVTGDIGSVDASGIFTAGHLAGSGSVVAVMGGAQGSASVTVTPGPPASIRVTPSSAVLAVASQTTFAAVVVDQYGNPIAGASVAWSVEGGVGTITGAGAFTAAQTVGTGRVVATSGTASGTATVVLGPGPAAEVRIAPPEASVAAGSSLELRAEVLDAYGNVIPDAAIAWTVSGSGTLSDTSGATTTLTAQGAGSVTVTATSGSASGSATVQVAEPGGVSGDGNVAAIGIGGAVAGILIGLATGWLVGRRRKEPKASKSDKKEDEEGDEE